MGCEICLVFSEHLFHLDVTFCNMWKIKTRVKIAIIIVVLKVLLLFLICDFGHGHRTCARYVLWTAATYPLAITYDTDLEDLCGNLTWATGPQFLMSVIFFYVVLDIVIYVTFFYVEDKSPPRRRQVRFVDGRLAFDRSGRPVMNL